MQFIGIDLHTNKFTCSYREQAISPVVVPPVEIQELRGLFTTYRFYKKQTSQIKNRIHSLLKEKLYGFTQEKIFDKKSREKIRGIEEGTPMSFQINKLLGLLEYLEVRVEALKEQIMVQVASLT